MSPNNSADNAILNDLSLIFGEVLFDCFPDGRQVLGGAPFNVAWNLQAFGLSPLLVSRIGDDKLGKRIREKMLLWHMNTGYIQIDPEYPTGTVHIELAGGEPQFTILPDQAYDHITPVSYRLQNEPAFLYHGSLAIRNDISRSALSHFKDDFQCPVFIDVNLRKPWWDLKEVNIHLEDATWLKLNENELDILFPGQGKMEFRCRQILERFNLKAVFVTLGEKGAWALNHANNIFRARPQDNIAIKDTVGAGDAFSAVLLLGLMKNWPLETTLRRAQEFASAVVGLRGAVTDDRNFYQMFTNKWNLK